MLAPGSATIAPPPPLTPINSLKAMNIQTTMLPKLQRIPRPGESIPLSNPELNKIEMPKLTPRPGMLSNISYTSQNEVKSLVGSLTTWFPPSSTIQVGNEDTANSVRVTRPQFVEILGNRKFLIVPKHNFLSVVQNSASKPEENVSIPDMSPYNKNHIEITANIPNKPDSAKMGRMLNENHSSTENDLPSLCIPVTPVAEKEDFATNTEESVPDNSE